MTEQNVKLTVIAYYLSKFDVQGASSLGYKNITTALREISRIVGNGNSYLKLRRDEFDVLTNSHRRGYANRDASKYVLGMHEQLKNIAFADFTEIVSQMIYPATLSVNELDINSAESIDGNLSNSEIEALINAKDSNSKYLLIQSERKQRVYNRGIIENLKKLYGNRCQICNFSSKEFGASIVEAHHILPFSDSQNNDSDNIIILCPNHHRLIHQAHPEFNREQLEFSFLTGATLAITLNMHL